jgi:hypothetical protein
MRRFENHWMRVGAGHERGAAPSLAGTRGVAPAGAACEAGTVWALTFTPAVGKRR